MSAIEVGSTITARPWKQGWQLDPMRGIVVGPDPFGATERVLVWFPRLGVPSTGSTVQPILVAKIEVEGAVEDAPVTWTVEAARAIRRVVRESGFAREKDEIERWPLTAKVRIEAVLKAFNAARRAAA